MTVHKSNAHGAPAVSLTRDEADDLVRLVSRLLARSDGTELRGTRDELLARAKAVLAERRRRMDFFARALFSEPGWEMLLALYVNEVSGRRYTVGGLIEDVGAPFTTSIRWINYLEKEKLIERHAHPTDRRAVFIRITATAKDRLDAYFSDVPIDVGVATTRSLQTSSA